MKIGGFHSKVSAPGARSTDPHTGSESISQGNHERFSPSEDSQEKPWTFLFYNVAQGNLSTMSSHLLNELERVGSDDNSNIVALNYREQAAHESLLHRPGHHDGASTYFVTKHEKSSATRWLGEAAGSLLDGATAHPGQLRSKIIDQPVVAGDAAAMVKPETLKNFLLDSMKRYPAQRYALVVTGHGAAFQGQAIVRDNDGRHALSNDDLGRVLREVKAETGDGVGLVNLNTCYSANLETVYSLKDSTQAIVASQDVLALNTQPFAAVLQEVQKRLSAGLEVDEKKLAKIFVTEAEKQPLNDLYSPTLSAFETSGLEELGASVAHLQAACRESGVAPKVLRDCLSQAVSVDFSKEPRRVELSDLGSFAEVISKRVPEHSVKQAAVRVKRSLDKTLIAEQHHTQSGTLSGLVRKLPMLVGPQKDLSGASGLTVFWDPAEEKRLAIIEGSSYGKDHPIKSFMDYLGS